MRVLLFALLLVSSLAQGASPRYNCTNYCTFDTDIWPTGGPQPVTCKFYSATSATGPFLLKATFTPTSVAGGVSCKTNATFVVGLWWVTMLAVDSTGAETAQSAPPFAFESALPLAVPANVRITGPSF